MSHYWNRSGVVLRKYHGKLEAYLGSSGGPKLVGSAPGAGMALPIFVGAVFPLLVILAVVALLIVALTHPSHASSMSMMSIAIAGPTVITPPKTDEKKAPAKIREMERNLKALASELEAGQVEMAAGEITQERGEELEAKAVEMEDLQKKIDQYNRIAGVTEKARQVGRVTLPEETDIGRKQIKTTPGHLFVMSEAYKHYRGQQKQGWSSYVDLKGMKLGSKTITLRGEEAIQFEKKAFDPATLSTLGTDALVPIDRDPELVRYAEPEIQTIRQMLNEVATTSDTIKYVRHTATIRAAAVQTARGAAKPYLHITFDTQQTSVETIAVLSKVTEQDIDDAPRLVGIINDEMELDIKVQEEKQLVWNDGSGGTITGLFAPTSGIPEFDRAQAGDTLIDSIRRMRTDLRKLRVVPQFVAIDPVDWEDIELEKGTTSQYIWGLITDLRGPRIWSLNVVESDAMTNDVTGERRILMGDGKRGATVYNRQETRLAVGFVDDDFARNLRTLRAEERLGMAIKRPYAFEYLVTQAGA